VCPAQTISSWGARGLLQECQADANASISLGLGGESHVIPRDGGFGGQWRKCRMLSLDFLLPGSVKCLKWEVMETAAAQVKGSQSWPCPGKEGQRRASRNPCSLGEALPVAWAGGGCEARKILGGEKNGCRILARKVLLFTTYSGNFCSIGEPQEK
jgi:hypothetical protein